jgi:spermidine synthase
MTAAAFTAARGRLRATAIGVAVFVSGGVLLGVEIAASRVLAPLFGNSLYVWGAVIGVVLAGLAIGYAAGGAAADRAPAPPLLFAVILLGAGAVLLIPVIESRVLEFVVDWDPGPRLDPVVAMILLFGVPSVLLAAVTPIAVRLRAPELAVLGRTAGRLFSVSTCGSIVGCFVTAFWLVPTFGVRQLLALMAAALFVVAGVVALTERLWLPLGVAAAACAGAVAASFAVAPQVGGSVSLTASKNWSPVFRVRGETEGSTLSYNDGTVVYEKETQYHHLAVVDRYDGVRTLRFDSSFQSAMSLKNRFATVYPYTSYMQLGLAYDPPARRVLMIGLGGGSTVKRMWRDFPALRLQVVELDPVVAKVARRYFRVPPDGPRLHTTIEDGRRFLAKRDQKWDVIMIDAYYSDSIPFHLVTLEFLELARSRLAQDGVIVTNVAGSLFGNGSELFRSILRTYRAAFPTVEVYPVLEGPADNGAGIRNIIVVASNDAAPSTQQLLERWRSRRSRYPGAVNLSKAIRDRWDEPISAEGVPILSDDYAPTDSLLVRF